MLTLYKPPRRSSEGTDTSVEEIAHTVTRVPLPAGTPYLTKVNGKLVMAREKAPKVSDVAIDLLGEAFGKTKQVIHTRRRSASNPHGSLLINGELYVPATNPQIMPYTAPLPQQPWVSTPNLAPYPPQPYYPMPPGSRPQPGSTFTSFFIPNPGAPQMGFYPVPQQFSNGAPANQPQTKTETTKTTITVTSHICAGCGRIRSKKYHHLHPLKEGETPAPDFCKKCQKECSSSESEEPKKDKKKHSKKSKLPSRVPSEDYIIVEEELSQEETAGPRGRGRVRERVAEKYEVRRESPPRSRQPSRTRPRSNSRDTTFSIPKKPVRPAKFREAEVRGMINRQSPPIEYRHAEGVQESRIVEERAETYPKKISVKFYDDVPQEEVPPPQDKYRGRSIHVRESSERECHAPEPLLVRQGSPRYFFEDRETASSARSQNSRRRRRRERTSPSSPVTPPWEEPHVIQSRGDNDVFVVTESYDYRPTRRGNEEENRRRQEYSERMIPRGRDRPYQLSTQEAARYYHDDWSRAEPEPEPVREPLRRRDYAEPSYRRDRRWDAEISESEASFEYRIVDPTLPRVPSPPYPIYESRRADDWQARRKYPISSDSEDSLDRRSKGKRPQKPAVEIVRERQRSTSSGGPKYEPGASEGSSRGPSPRHSRERERVVYVDDISASERARVERAAEAITRHVTFREEPDMQSLHESWTTSTEIVPRETERRGSGRNEGRGGRNHADESDWER